MSKTKTNIGEPTPEQKARLETFYEEWFRIGACTDPADRPRAEAAISALYREHGNEAPQFVWCLSPWAAQKEIHGRNPGANFGEAMWHSLGDHPNSPINDAISSELRNTFDRGVWEYIVVYLEDSLNEVFSGGLVTMIEGQLDHDLERAIHDGNPSNLSDEHDACWMLGQHEVHWISYFRFAETMGIGIEHNARRVLSMWETLALSCMWWWPFERLCFVCDRPEAVHWEDERPHRAGGPAVFFRDGWSIWAWKGIAVPREIIEAPVTLEAIRSCENIEHQRILIDRYGLERYFEDSGAREVARDALGVLLEMEMPGGGAQQIVRVENPTPGPGGARRTYLLPLEGRYDNPTDAIGSTFGLPPGAYKPIKQA